MAEISKQALKVENNQSFPNNNAGAITPSDLRLFNVDMIDSTVNQLVYTADSGSWNVSASAALYTASFAGQTLTFRKGDGSTFGVVLTGAAIDTGSFVITSSFNAYTESTNARLNNLESTTASLNTSVSNINLFTSSQDSKNLTLASFTASVSNSVGLINAFTSSANSRLSGLESLTGSYATTGSNSFNGNQAITGSLIITQNLTVLGSASITYVTSSQVNIGTNFINLNTDTPSVRFGGINVIDSGSNGLTGSLMWDSLNNRWLYANPSGSAYNSAILINGPQNSGALGSEVGLVTNYLQKAVGGDHISQSKILDDGSVVSIQSDTTITGSLTITGTVDGVDVSTLASNFISFTASQFVSNSFFATTGSNTFKSFQNFTDPSANTFGFTSYSGSLVFSGNTFTSGAANLGFISSSASNRFNIILKGNNNTGDILISGSNNIIANPNTPQTGFKSIVGNSNVMIGQQSFQITGSYGHAFNMNNNYLGTSITNALVMRSPQSSSTYAFQNNVLNNSSAITLGLAAGTSSMEGARSGLTFAHNFINGGYNISAGKTILSSSVVLQQSNVNSTLAVFADSSSVQMVNATVGGQMAVWNSYYPSTINATSHTLTVQGMAHFGSNLNIYASGSNSTFASGRLINNLFNTGTNNSASVNLNGDLSHINSVSLLGAGLNVTGSNSRVTTLPHVAQTDFGSTFVGRFNKSDGIVDRSAENVFVVGTGTSNTARKNAVLIDSGSNIYLEGTLNISGSTSVTGSVVGNVNALTISSNTASIDFSLGSFFTLQLVNGTATHVTATNVKVGQTINLLVTQAATPGTIGFSPVFKYPVGSTYTATTSAGAKDIVTFVTLDSTTSIYSTAVKNLA
jgi:hypothetical protein